MSLCKGEEGDGGKNAEIPIPGVYTEIKEIFPGDSLFSFFTFENIKK